MITGTCPAISLPYDIVFVVDRSNSMTKGLGGPGPVRTVGPGDPTRDPADPTKPSVDPFPTQEKPKPTEPPIPTPPTALHSTAGLMGHRVPGLAQGPIVPTETMEVPPTEPVGTPGKPTPPIKDPTGEPGRDPTRDLIRRDREEPAGDEDLIRAVREAILDFLDHVEGDVNSGRYRVALVSFNDRARIEVDLNRSNSGVSKVRSRLFRIRGGGNTRIDLGLSAALRVLYGVTYRGRQDLDYKKVAILFSDGKADPRTTARLRLRKDITYLSVAAGRSADIRVMRGLASEGEFFLDLRDRKELVERVRGLPAKSRGVNMTSLTVADRLQPNMELVAASAIPAPARTLADGTLEWDFPNPSMPVTVTYEVRPLAVGVHPVSQSAEARWGDSEARNGKVPFPGVDIEVVGLPTPTKVPTPTIEDTPSPVPEIKAAYLPISYNALACSPRKQTVDVALIVDASLSMGDPTQAGGITKLDAAIRAGRAFVSLLKTDDQGAVVGFNASAHLLAELTSDKGAVNQALGRLPDI
ncbi:MAG: VWA domain-containing protein, partial [Anaerolineae bacterium]